MSVVLSPLNDEDRWAVIAALSMRYGLSYDEIRRAVGRAEVECWRDADEPLKGSRVNWRAELADAAVDLFRGKP